MALRHGDRLVGSRTTAAFARASGVPEDRIVVRPSGTPPEIGDLTVTFVPSLHGRIVAGRVPFPGEVVSPPALPARFWHDRMGGAFGILIRAGGRAIYHNGSADLVDAELHGLRADVLLVGLAGRKATRDYLARRTGLLSPGLLVPTTTTPSSAPSISASVSSPASTSTVSSPRLAASLPPPASSPPLHGHPRHPAPGARAHDAVVVPD